MICLRKFQDWFPLTSHQIVKLKGGEASELFAKNNVRSRIACGKLLGVRICLYPVQATFFTAFDLVLLIEKIIQISQQIFCCVCLSRRGSRKFKATLQQVGDYWMLLFLLPWFKLSKISLLACAMFINPKFYFKRPEAVSTARRADYFYSWTIRFVEQLLLYKELNLETKAALHELENGMNTLQEALEDPCEKEACFKVVYQHVKNLRLEITCARLEQLKVVLLECAKRKKIPLQIRLPLIGEDEVIEEVPLTSNKNLVVGVT
jgi:hypothetical protein